MTINRRVLILALLMAIFSWAAGHAFASPVLIKLELKDQSEYENAEALNVQVFHRIGDLFIAEHEESDLRFLQDAGLTYQIIDKEPWTENYYLISESKKFEQVDLSQYGEVLVDGEDFYFMKISDEGARSLAEKGYHIVKVFRDTIPLKYKPMPEEVPKARLYDPGIDSLLSLVSEDSLYTWDLRLQNFQTRYSYTDSIHAARQWIFDKFVSFGIDSVWFHHYYWDSHQYNVVATVVGTAQPDKVIVVGGHYDSVVYGGGTDPYTWAPGADDNGSGTVATLEMARIIAENPLPVTVMFVPFAQEEQGLVGSYYFAGYLSNNNADVELMINSDMIGHSVDADTDVVIYAAPGAMQFVDIMMAMANTYTYLDPSYGGESGGSDHYSFYQWGYDALFAQEGEFHYAGWHTNYDLVDSLDFDYMREVVKMCLATVLNVGLSPSPVEDLEAVDAGDGHTVYLSWSASPPEEDVVSYNVYFGTASGDYDSVHEVYTAGDTLGNLEENTTYFMTVTAVNANGFEGAITSEVSIAPRGVPLPPTGLVADPSGSFKIRLTWFANQEADLDYYNIYRSEESGSGYQLLSEACTETTFVDSSVEGDVEYYYYTLTAVDTSGNESEMSDEAESFVISLNQGILVVDETYINTTMNMVDGDSVNAFYDRALEDYTYAYADHSYPNGSPPNQISVTELGRYSVVIVHSEDNRESYSMGAYGDSTYAVLKEYLSFGGKVIIEGRRNLSTGYAIDCGMREFFPGDVPYDYLKIQSAYVPCWSPSYDRTEEFIGAFGQAAGYPDLQVDSLRVAQCASGLELEGKVPGVGYIDNLMAGEVIYTFHSAYDTSSSEGQPVAFRYLGEGPEVIFFDFPLYFIHEPQATELLHQALADLGMFTYLCGDANDDGVVDVADVMYLINYLFIGGSAPEPLEAGDANTDGVLDIADVMYLINYLFIDGPAPCAQKTGPLAKTKPASAQVGIGVPKVNKTGAAISVESEFDVDVAAIQLTIEWDQAKFEVSDISLTSRTQELGLYHNDGKDGELKIGLADISGKGFVTAGKGALLKLNVKSKVDSLDLSSLEIRKAILVDRNANKLAVQIAGKPGQTVLPKEFSLSQNYPNPFNPQTVIQYTLPRDCEVEITIYNLLGQKVRTLVSGYQQAGHKRAMWCGDNDQGDEASSGIYFYTIKAAEFIQTKKMVMLK